MELYVIKLNILVTLLYADSRLQAISALGLLLGLLQLIEGVMIWLGISAPPEGMIVGVLTSLPFILWLMYGGYWVGQSELPPERYQRISRRTLGGLAGFLVINIAIMAAAPPENLLMVFGWFRWAGALGGGIGLLIGVFEARAIHHELQAERGRLQRQRLREQNEQLEEFASLVSHDLRNPLSVAQGRLKLAQKEVETAHHEAIGDALDRMETLIGDLLTLAREGRQVSETEPVRLEEIAEAAWQSVSTDEARLTVESEGSIAADPTRVQQLLENLFRNAIDHAGDDVIISIGAIEGGFFVEDTGPGIPEDKQDNVLEPGYSTADEGTGFGLAIVKQIADAHDWDVEVMSGTASGARFEFTGVDRPPAD